MSISRARFEWEGEGLVLVQVEGERVLAVTLSTCTDEALVEAQEHILEEALRREAANESQES